MLLHEKADQAQALLHETGLDCWLTFGRETGIHPDPGIELVVGTDVTWISAFLFSRDGRRIAVVGRYHVANVRAAGVFGEVIGYDGPGPPPGKGYYLTDRISTRVVVAERVQVVSFAASLGFKELDTRTISSAFEFLAGLTQKPDHPFQVTPL